MNLYALLAVAVLAMSACGARLDAAQLAAAQGGTNNGTKAATGGATGASTTVPGATGASTGAGATGGAAATGTGDTGGAAAGDAGAAGAACAPTPGTAGPGVTDAEVKFGNVSTISGPVPGFGQTGVNGVKAYFNYINSQGGACGRKLTLATADDRLDAGQNRASFESLKDQVLGFVGGTTVVDGGGAAVLDGTSIPDTALAVGDGAVASPNVFSPNPIDPAGTSSGVANIFTWLKANKGITKVGVVYPAQSDARARAEGYQNDIRAAGLEVDGPYEVAVTETNYAGTATKMKNDGADAFITALEVNGMARLAAAVQQVGFQPKAAFYGAQAYGQQFLKLAGPAAEGAIIGVAYSIFEDAPNNPAVANFVEWYGRTNPGSDPDFFAIIGWAAADMMVQALTAAGGAPSREAVIGALRTFSSFDAHGLISACDPPGKHPATAFAIIGIQGGQWTRIFPGQGFGTN
ncbi:MAG: ABC transporter substrate-binding protein [Acidimicrobiales bacterium]